MGSYHINAASPGQAVSAVFTHTNCWSVVGKGSKAVGVGRRLLEQSVSWGGSVHLPHGCYVLPAVTSAGAYMRFREGRLFLAAYFGGEADRSHGEPPVETGDKRSNIACIGKRNLR